jgi:hypothetical protein
MYSNALAASLMIRLVVDLLDYYYICNITYYVLYMTQAAITCVIAA